MPARWCCVSLVPMYLDPMASRPITMVGRHKPEQTAVGAVSEQMTPHFDAVTHLDVLALGAVPNHRIGTGGLERPRGRLAFVVLDVEVDPRMRDDQVDFLDQCLSCSTTS